MLCLKVFNNDLIPLLQTKSPNFHSEPNLYRLLDCTQREYKQWTHAHRDRLPSRRPSTLGPQLFILKLRKITLSFSGLIVHCSKSETILTIDGRVYNSCGKVRYELMRYRTWAVLYCVVPLGTSTQTYLIPTTLNASWNLDSSQIAARMFRYSFQITITRDGLRYEILNYCISHSVIPVIPR